MSIQLVTYASQTVTPTNDAIIYERAIDQNGIFYGCNVTVTSNNVNITGGYGIICGREFVIQSESIAVTLAPSGTLAGRLYVRLDLADADNPIQLLTATGNTLPALTQDADVNYTNGTYEMELATFDVGVSSLSNCVETFATIVGTQSLPFSYKSGTSGDWTYKKYADGTFEATMFKTNGGTGAMTQISGGTGAYYSSAAQINFPSIGIQSISSCSVNMAPDQNYIMDIIQNRLTTSSVYIIYLRYGSSSAVSNISYSVHITGTWA